MLATLPQTTSHAGMSYIILRTAMWLLTQRVYVTGPACRKLKMRFQESVQEESSIVTLSFTSCRGVGTLTAAGRNWRLKTRVWTVIKKFFVNQKPLKTTVCLAACWPLLPLFQALRAEMRDVSFTLPASSFCCDGFEPGFHHRVKKWPWIAVTYPSSKHCWIISPVDPWALMACLSIFFGRLKLLRISDILPVRVLHLDAARYPANFSCALGEDISTWLLTLMVQQWSRPK